MIQLTDIQNIIGRSLFEGAGDVAGLIIFAIALAFILKITHDTLILIILMIPLLLILSIMGVISSTILFIMIIAMVIIIALKTSTSLFGE